MARDLAVGPRRPAGDYHADLNRISSSGRGRPDRFHPGPTSLAGPAWTLLHGGELQLKLQTLAAFLPSLGYEQCDVRLRCLGPSLGVELAWTYGQAEVAPGPRCLHRPTVSRHVSLTSPFTSWAPVGPSSEIAGLSASAEGQRLQRIGRTAKDSVKLLRAIVVLMSAQGQSAPDMAHLLAVARAVSTRLTKSARAAYIVCGAKCLEKGRGQNETTHAARARVGGRACARAERCRRR